MGVLGHLCKENYASRLYIAQNFDFGTKCFGTKCSKIYIKKYLKQFSI